MTPTERQLRTCLAAEPAWEVDAVRIALRAADRPGEKSGVVDSGLCHGAAGLGHLFNRTYQGHRRAATGRRGPVLVREDSGIAPSGRGNWRLPGIATCQR